MVSLRNTAVLAAATLATSNAVQTLAADDEKALMLELSVYVRDIANNMQQYLSFRQQHPNEPYPAVLNTVVLQAAGSSDDSWTTALTGIAPAMVERMLTGVPWYSSRIYPALTSKFAQAGVVVEGIDASAVATTTASSTSSVATSTAASTSSSKAASSSSKAASSSSKAASSSKATSSSAATTTSASKATSSASNAQAISQIGDGQIQATHTVSQHTNGGAKVVAGLGAGALAAAALLI
ncbi:SRP1/TIP1 family protein PWA37_002841 [Arxiozyma heterogenica]|uniref:Uncharacterized protein n=1 Tax=Arxiozyma heterogenica TaxID=278026 RepID=A0AAN7W252_9SACH|nr:hypothetical protein RI543_003551 [Kazachstania heterogenica]